MSVVRRSCFPGFRPDVWPVKLNLLIFALADVADGDSCHTGGGSEKAGVVFVRFVGESNWLRFGDFIPMIWMIPVLLKYRITPCETVLHNNEAGVIDSNIRFPACDGRTAGQSDRVLTQPDSAACLRTDRAAADSAAPIRCKSQRLTAACMCDGSARHGKLGCEYLRAISAAPLDASAFDGDSTARLRMDGALCASFQHSAVQRQRAVD